MPEKLHIVFCPLNWGLGHASRMIPLIYGFLRQECRITIISSGAPLLMLKEEFSDHAEFIYFQEPAIKYTKGGSLVFKMALQIPVLLTGMLRERFFIRKMVSMSKPDIIISDNRYGMRSKKALSVFVTHQIHIKLPNNMRRTEKAVNFLNRWLTKSFDCCIVPDYENGPGLSGSLSHNVELPALHFTGPLSRFQIKDKRRYTKPLPGLPDDFILVILSGPEPQRSILEKLLPGLLSDITCIWFRGLPGNNKLTVKGKHYYFDHAGTDVMEWCIQKSKIVISRSGYSTIMDLSVFGKKAVFIPTPGQTEQEYLACLMEESGYAASVQQHEIKNLSHAIEKALQCKGLPLLEQTPILENTITMLIKMAGKAAKYNP